MQNGYSGSLFDPKNVNRYKQRDLYIKDIGLCIFSITLYRSREVVTINTMDNKHLIFHHDIQDWEDLNRTRYRETDDLIELKLMCPYDKFITIDKRRWRKKRYDPKSVVIKEEY